MAVGVRGRAGNLPLELSSFVGRRREVAKAKRALAASRLLTLIGVGGVGKTRLALRTAAEIQRAFDDGVWLIELDQLHDPALVPHTVARALGLREEPGQPTLTSVTEYLATRRLLLVLDNCEHLIGACAELAEALLSAAPDVRVLATSREPLGVRGEATQLVPSLTFPDPEQLHSWSDLSAYEAVSLFADRAASVLSDFEVGRANQDAVVEICDRLDGLPLAIELAAVRLRALSPQQLAQRLTDHYRLLTTELRGAPTRQQTLDSCIGWSYDLCSDTERLLWARASVFAGGFELDAAEEICAGDGLPPEDLLDVVTALVGKSILIRDEHRAVVRFRLLETMREFGRDKLRESGEHPALRQRHMRWCEQLVGQAEADWVSPRQGAWFGRLDREHANVQVALNHCLTEPVQVESALRILVALFYFYWWGRSWGREGRHWFGRALSLPAEPSAIRAMALLVESALALADGDFGPAELRTAEGCALATQFGDVAARGFCFFVRGSAALYSRDLQGAIALGEEGLSALAPGTCLPIRLDLLLIMAVAAGVGGDEQRASALHKEMLGISEPAGERFHRAYALWALGLLALRQGDLGRAAGLQHQSLRLRRGLRELTGIAWSMESLAWVEAAAGRPERAATLLGAADRRWETLGRSLQSYQHLMPYRESCEQTARQALGDQKFQATREYGRRLSTDDAVAFALDEKPRAPSAPAAEGAALTRREREVAGLVAEGLTNKEIAARLVIAQRTAEGHVERILVKLGFSSRAQLASWVATQQAKPG